MRVAVSFMDAAAPLSDSTRWPIFASKSLFSATSVRARCSLAACSAACSSVRRLACARPSRNTWTACAIAPISSRRSVCGMSASRFPSETCRIAAVMPEIGREMPLPISQASTRPMASAPPAVRRPRLRDDCTAPCMAESESLCSAMLPSRILETAASRSRPAASRATAACSIWSVAVTSPLNAFSNCTAGSPTAWTKRCTRRLSLVPAFTASSDWRMASNSPRAAAASAGLREARKRVAAPLLVWNASLRRKAFSITSAAAFSRTRTGATPTRSCAGRSPP